MLNLVVFPLLMYSDDDEAMWDSDAEEFVTGKYDAYEVWKFFAQSIHHETEIIQGAA